MTGSNDSSREGGALGAQGTAVPAPVAFPFDVVVLDGEGGGFERRLSPTEFFSLPLAERIKHVVQGRASFYSGGRRIEARDVLGTIRKQRTSTH